MSSAPESEIPKRKSRKKLTYHKIQTQMEFYFSAGNLSKDRWISQKLQEEDCISLTEFLRFNKIRALTQDVNDLAKALRKSEVLEVTEDLKVKLLKPVKLKENEEDYVIYVEQVPPDADHDWVKSIFSVYGDIDYVSLPKFKNSNKCKGFVFVEFASPESAQNAIKDFKEKGNYLSTDIAPEELLSIANYEKDGKNPIENTKEVPPEIPMEPVFQESIEEPSNPRKRKNSEVDENTQDGKKKRLDNEEESAGDSQDITVTDENSEVEETKIKKKKNRKKKKKKNKETSDNFGLQILSKKDWKRLRNKYLNIQREKMKQLKKHLYWTQKKLDPSRNQSGPPKKLEDSSKEEKNKIEEAKMPFQAGLIVKIKLDEPVVEVKPLKNEMKKNISIKYVDVKEGDNIVHLRFESPETALDFCEGSTYPETKLLEGQKEAEYWERMEQQRHKKLTTKINKKGRGKEKLMKKAEHILGKHIIFDDI